MSETHTITIEPLDREVECREDQSILDACLRAGRVAAARLHARHLRHLQGRRARRRHRAQRRVGLRLMEFERNEGKCLVCVATPTSDVTLEADVDFEAGVTYHPVDDYTGTVVELSDIARETRRLVIELDKPMVFNPGQYIAIDVPGTDQNRTYSMGNPPSEPNRIELQIRRTPGGLGTDGWVFKTSRWATRCT